jgi:hypothetical protein
MLNILRKVCLTNLIVILTFDTLSRKGQTWTICISQ